MRFQFPLSERTNCNPITPDQRAAIKHAFSFLYRNERTATQSRAKSRKVAMKLSVSSIGTNELQPGKLRARSPITVPFSFLYRNERTATQKFRGWLRARTGFQFPLSERTNCNARTMARAGGHIWIFQFPLSERTNCNLSQLPKDFDTKSLSVSSIGTNELQLCSPTKSATRKSNLSVSSIGTNELQRQAG